MTKVPVKFNLPEIGEVEILLSEDQLKKTLADGKRLYKENTESPESTSDYVYSGSPTSTTTNAGNNLANIDWDSFFPDIPMDEIKELAEKAVSQKEETRKKALAVCSLIRIALGAYMGGESKIDFKNIDFFKKEEPKE